MMCPECSGEGGVEESTGYRVYGSGFGDAEATYRVVACIGCDGSGEVAEEDTMTTLEQLATALADVAAEKAAIHKAFPWDGVRLAAFTCQEERDAYSAAHERETAIFEQILLIGQSLRETVPRIIAATPVVEGNEAAQ